MTEHAECIYQSHWLWCYLILWIVGCSRFTAIMKGDSSSPRTAPRQSASFMLPYVVAAAFCCFDVFNYYYFFSPITNIWSWGTFQTSKLSMSYLLATSLSSVCLLLFVTFYFSILMSNGYEYKCSSGFSRQMLNLLPYSTRMKSVPISSGSAMLPPIFVSFLDFNFGVFVCFLSSQQLTEVM